MNLFIKEIQSNQLASSQIDSPEFYRIIDVRETRETAQGVIEGAEKVPLATLPTRLTEFLAEEKPVVFVCRSGARSAQACNFLQQHGFENAYNLRGGMMAWLASNLPIT